MADLIGSTLGPNIAVRLELAPDLPPAQADANQLEMALLNLAVNARDAMPDRGDLTITAKPESVRDEHRSGLAPGHYVRLGVRDTGVGMTRATLERAIEPFFSTTGVGQGTGLGLSGAVSSWMAVPRELATRREVADDRGGPGFFLADTENSIFRSTARAGLGTHLSVPACTIVRRKDHH
jgi:C4-dicarboxylate-specific signal transduction histidine kinase